MAHKRLNFQLDQELARLFLQRAKAMGSTKAKLLRQVILTTSDLDISRHGEYHSTKPTTFNFRMDPNVQRVLAHWQSRYGFAASALVRIALSQYLVANLPRVEALVPQKATPRLVKKSSLEEVAAYYENRHEELSVAQVVELARMNLILGDLNKVHELVTKAEQSLIARPVDAPEFAQIWLTKGIYLRHKRQLTSAQKYVQQALKLAQKYDLVDVSTTAWAELSVLSGLHEDFAQALRQSEAGMELTTIDKQPSSYVKSYLRLASLYSMLGDQVQSYRYVEKCLNLLQTLPTKRGLYAHVYTRLSLIYARFRDLTSVSIARSRLDSNGVSGMDLHFNSENKGLAALLNSNFTEAYAHFDHSEKLETSLRGNQTFSKVRLWKLFIESKHDLPYSLRQLSSLQYQQQNPYPSLVKYVSASAKFINGDKPAQRQAALELEKISQTGKYPLLKQGAQRTLFEKQIQLVV